MNPVIFTSCAVACLKLVTTGDEKRLVTTRDSQAFANAPAEEMRVRVREMGVGDVRRKTGH